MLTCMLLVTVLAQGERRVFADPAPPQVRTLEPIEQPEATATAELTFHAAPRTLSADAVVEDWSSFLGPRRDGHCVEGPLDLDFDASGPKLVWEVERGEGYASPAIAAGRLVFTHRVGNEVHIDCMDPLTGKRFWRHTIPCEYEGRYIKNSGPRSSPTIVDDHVYVHSVDGVLLCLELSTGRVVWQRDTNTEFEVGDDFFGVVSSPLVVGDLLIQNVGSPDGPCVAAFRRKDGRLAWGSGTGWGPSCASPVLARAGGAERLFVVAGGDSRPPTGGLMILDPTDGAVQCHYSFRSRTYESVNGSSPVVFGDSVFLTAAYGVGSAVLSVKDDGTCSEVWRERRGLACEFSTPVYHDGLVYAVDGVSGRGGAVVAIDPETGTEKARATLQFEEAGGKTSSIGAGSLLHVGDAFLVLGDTGNLAVVRPRAGGFNITAKATLFRAPEAWTPPVISNGLLYVCQNNRERAGASPARLLCYDVRGGSSASGD